MWLNFPRIVATLWSWSRSFFTGSGSSYKFRIRLHKTAEPDPFRIRSQDPKKKGRIRIRQKNTDPWNPYHFPGSGFRLYLSFSCTKAKLAIRLWTTPPCVPILERWSLRYSRSATGTWLSGRHSQRKCSPGQQSHSSSLYLERKRERGWAKGGEGEIKCW